MEGKISSSDQFSSSEMKEFSLRRAFRRFSRVSFDQRSDRGMISMPFLPCVRKVADNNNEKAIFIMPLNSIRLWWGWIHLNYWEESIAAKIASYPWSTVNRYWAVVDVAEGTTTDTSWQRDRLRLELELILLFLFSPVYLRRRCLSKPISQWSSSGRSNNTAGGL